MRFEYEADEIQVEISDGVFATMTGNFAADATIDNDGNITVDRVYIDAGGGHKMDGKRFAKDENGNFIRLPSKWERIDDVPAMKAVSEAVERMAGDYIPD